LFTRIFPEQERAFSFLRVRTLVRRGVLFLAGTVRAQGAPFLEDLFGKDKTQRHSGQAKADNQETQQIIHGSSIEDTAGMFKLILFASSFCDTIAAI